MSFWDNKENVLEYIKMCEAAPFDVSPLLAVLRQHLPDGLTLLELGMGAGWDLDALGKYFEMVGSDYSQPFWIYREKHPDADLLLLDAVTLDTDRRFDCIYSNKVLHHLATEQLAESLARQAELLNDGGIIFHTFWHGDKIEEFEGMLFVYYKLEQVIEIAGDRFKLLASGLYREFADDDSFYICLKKD